MHCHSERSEESLTKFFRQQEMKSEMFRFAQHDKDRLGCF
jgi:hypothetical protein